jgi:hypothetical protein
VKKLIAIAIVLMIALNAFAIVTLKSNRLSVQVSGNMPIDYSLIIVPTRDSYDIDLFSSQGSQINVANYLFTANGLVESTIALLPTTSQGFIISDGSSGGYPFEMAICSYNPDGSVRQLIQGNSTSILYLTVNGEVQGDIIACLPYLDGFFDPYTRTYSSTVAVEVRPN